MVSFSTTCRVAIEAAKTAGGIIYAARSRGLAAHFKEKGEKVTAADRLVNIRIKQILNSALGPQNIITEETGFSPGQGELLWIIDPLDGTNNFYTGKKECCVGIAAIKGNQPVIGITFNPFTGEFYAAEQGRGAYLNGNRIHCTTKEKFENLTLFVEKSSNLPEAALTAVLNSLPVNKTILLNSSGLALSRTAAGKADAFLKLSIKQWDSAPGHAILKESGCLVTDCYGNPFLYDQKELINVGKKTRNLLGLIAAPPALHEPLVKAVRDIRRKIGF